MPGKHFSGLQYLGFYFSIVLGFYFFSVLQKIAEKHGGFLPYHLPFLSYEENKVLRI
jgi:hypothetical protein